MAASTDWELYQLYLELGEAHTKRRALNEAADAYALSLYYARRMGDAGKVDQCRQLILERNPNHVAGQAVSAPLLFAHLLMRYPVDEARRQLPKVKQEAEEAENAQLPLEFESPPAAYSLEIYPSAVAISDENVPPTHAMDSAPAHSGRRPKAPQHGGDDADYEHHHYFDLGVGEARRAAPTAVAEDFLLKDAGLLDEPLPKRKPGRTLPSLAIFTIVVSIGFAGYFGYDLYPKLWNMNVERAVGSFLNEDENDSRPVGVPVASDSLEGGAEPADTPEFPILRETINIGRAKGDRLPPK